MILSNLNYLWFLYSPTHFILFKVPHPALFNTFNIFIITSLLTHTHTLAYTHTYKRARSHSRGIRTTEISQDFNLAWIILWWVIKLQTLFPVPTFPSSPPCFGLTRSVPAADEVLQSSPTGGAGPRTLGGTLRHTAAIAVRVSSPPRRALREVLLQCCLISLTGGA